MHGWPPLPHWLSSVPARHVLPSQHPPQLELSQVQPPAWHRCPARHGGPAPQRHAPLPQLSASNVLQLTHAAPPVPHAVLTGGATHVLPLQQPLGQLVASHTHTPTTQRWPAAHAAAPPHRQLPPEQLSAVAPHAVHAAALVPHCAAVGGLTQVLPAQQPDGQFVVLHPTHCCIVQLSAPQLAHTAPFAPH
jgi:hypothetical protein